MKKVLIPFVIVAVLVAAYFAVPLRKGSFSGIVVRGQGGTGWLLPCSFTTIRSTFCFDHL